MPFEAGGSVAFGLDFGCGKVFTGAVFLGFNHTASHALHKQHIIGRTGIGGIFAHRHAYTCRLVELLHILNNPAVLFELQIDLLARLCFGSHRGFSL